MDQTHIVSQCDIYDNNFNNFSVTSEGSSSENNSLVPKVCGNSSASRLSNNKVIKLFYHYLSLMLQIYSINLVNPTRKSEGVIKKLRALSDFVTVEDLMKQVYLILKSPNYNLQLGYYEPGHGTKGKRDFSLTMKMF